MDQEELKLKIRQLALYQFELAKEDTSVVNIELHQMAISLKSEILKSFGLPGTSDHSGMLDVEGKLTEEEVHITIESLKSAATAHLLTTPIPDIKLLTEAQRQSIEAEEVMSQLHLRLHIYNFFVYEHILLSGKDSPENVYKVLTIANDPQVLSQLALLVSCNKLGKEEKTILRRLKRLGVHYLDEYLETYRTKNKKTQ